MGAYNGVAGVDERALNLFVSDFYDCAREHIFHRVVSVAGKGLEPLASLEYEVNGAPRIGFMTPPQHPSGGSSTSSFELWVDHFKLTLHYAGAVPPTALAGTVHATANRAATPQAVFLRLD